MLTTLLRPINAPLRVESEVLVPLATPSAVEALVEMPGMAAVRSAIPVIVET